MYVKVTDGVATEYSLNQLRRDNPNVSFPANPRTETLTEWDVYPLNVIPDPDYDAETQKLVLQPIQQVNGVWMKFKLAEQLTQEEIDARLAQKRSKMSVSMRQARLALSQAGKLSLIDQAIELIPEPDKTQISIEWEYAQTVDRTSPWISTMMGVLEMNDVELDALFELASSL